MKKRRTKREELLTQPKIFCTECGAELENFCFSRGANDEEAIRKTMAQCRKKGRLAGDFCSKLFVAGDSDLDSLWDRESGEA